MFEELYFVPVLRDKDNCYAPRIGQPWSPLAKKRDPTQSSLLYESPPSSHSPLSPMFEVSNAPLLNYSPRNEPRP